MARKPTHTQPGLFGPLAADGPDPTWVAAEQARLVRIAFEAGGDAEYDYALSEDQAAALQPGQRVEAAFGKGGRSQVGFCVGFPDHAEVAKVRRIANIIDEEPLISAELMSLGRWISQYYCCTLGAALAAMVPAAVKKQVGLSPRHYVRLTDAGRGYAAGATSQSKVSAAGQAVLSFLAAQEHAGLAEMRLDAVISAVNCSAGPVQTLARQGLVNIERRKELPHVDLGGNEPAAAALTLNADQQAAYERLTGMDDEGGFHAACLHGVTGSGKTEVYIRIIERVVARGEQALVLVPEISLTPQTTARFRGRFGQVAILHSGMSASQRHQYWRSIARGQANVVVGARSAVFAPLPRLGMIVVDEEHEPSYKQDQAPRYHARDVAVKRAQMRGITVVLGSATPSLETYANCAARGHYVRLSLPRRVLELPLPPVAVVDMATEAVERKGAHLFSRMLEGELRRCLAREKQAIILLNRRGHSNYIFCPACSYAVRCPNCDVGMTYHRRRRDFDNAQQKYIMCHYCLHMTRVPQHCPVCSRKLILVGPGTQRAEDELREKFPDARFRRVDSDAMRPGQFDELLSDFGAGAIDILLGTQMIGKGLDFPNVSLVGVLNADVALALPDIRSSERTFQLIAQVAGRCGRAGADGQVIVQSYLPDEPAVALACRHDYETFARQETEHRRRLKLPPYARLARIVLRDRKLDRAEAAGQGLRRDIDALCREHNLAVEVRGPVPAAIATIEGRHRQEIVLKAAAAGPIQELLGVLRRTALPRLTVDSVVDVDPLNML